MARHVQVFCFGHSLSGASRAWLTSEFGTYKVHKVFFNAPQLKDVPGATRGVLRTLRKQGADFSSGKGTKTIFVLPGLGAGAAMLLAGWLGITGTLPAVLNLIRLGDDTYGPCPEMPLLELHEFKNEVGRPMRSDFFDGVEAA